MKPVSVLALIEFLKFPPAIFLSFLSYPQHNHNHSHFKSSSPWIQSQSILPFPYQTQLFSKISNHHTFKLQTSIKMANLRTLSTLTVLLTLLFTFFTTVLANGQEPNGRILCDPTYDPHICQLRVTMYFRNFPKCNDGVSSFACFDVYDHWCKQIGTSHNNGGIIPWLIDFPFNCTILIVYDRPRFHRFRTTMDRRSWFANQLCQNRGVEGHVCWSRTVANYKYRQLHRLGLCGRCPLHE